MSDSAMAGDEEAAEFDEAAYLVAFPKIAEKVRAGQLKSGHDHFARQGAAEGRLSEPRYLKALNEQGLLRRLSETRGGQKQPLRPGQVASGLDALLVCEGGTCLLIGWAEDRGAPLQSVSLALPEDQVVVTTAIARCRRADAETAIGCPPGHLLGFYALLNSGQMAPPGPGTSVVLQNSTDLATYQATPKVMRAEALRDTIFEYIAAATYFGSPIVEGFLQMDAGIGEPLLAMNRTMSAGITRLAHVERFGPQDRAFIASIVVCLYGKPEYLFLQAALFSTAARAAEYEFVYVSNSPELTEVLQREARIAARVYGLSITLVFLPGNAGFGAANNVAVGFAQSDRIMIVNPDVFPRRADWAVQHAELVDALPAEQTRLFGAPLFYDDGSLMHGGMFFEQDVGLSVKPDGIREQTMLRVEHYGKGAPPDTMAYRRSRAVPAVTGAFMSTDRAWFEKLGGFSEEYVFGHYEDADLCLKSWREGGAVWLHNLPFWHLEGKGSTRRATHEGGSLINRWHFTRTWLADVQGDFGGPTPARLAR